MRIISWNCNGRFREKHSSILEYNADIYVIQECENPAYQTKENYRLFAANSLWIGDNPYKGLGIFAKDSICLSHLDWPSYCLRYFLPVRVANRFNLLGVWACEPYISEYYIYQNINMQSFNSDTVIIGDFNSNAIWDKQHKKRNHSTVVNELSDLGLVSAYHTEMQEDQGKESIPTFFQYRHQDKGFHIDHCFVSKTRIARYSILTDPHWFTMSDHRPICLDIY